MTEHLDEEPPRKKRPKPPTPEQMAAERAQTKKQGFIALVVLSMLMPTLFLINLVRTKHRHDEEMGLVPATRMTAVDDGTPKRVLDNEEDLTITPAVAKPSRHDVAFSIGSILPDTKACFRPGTQGVQATWQVNPDGSATDVKPLQGVTTAAADAGGDSPEAFACVAAAVKQAHVAPFDGAAVRVTYTFRDRPRR